MSTILPENDAAAEGPSSAGDLLVADNRADERIIIRGARMHNLRNVDLDIPRMQLVVITGPSGSGKSSLALDTLFAEGQRQYIESLSVYARQFLHQMERPDVDLIEGLQPTLCINQQAGSQNPRSTVATVTEIYDHLRLLMARVGQPHCHQCGTPIRQQSAEQIQDRLLRLPEGTKCVLLAPMVRGRKGQHQDVLAAIRKAGYVRVRLDGEVYDIDNVPELAPRKSHNLDAVIDRIVIRPTAAARIRDSINVALKHGQGSLISMIHDPEAIGPNGEPGVWNDELYSTLYACPNCEISFEELEPRTFSFNSGFGACQICEGVGTLVEFDPELVIPDWEKSLADGAIAAWKGSTPGELKKHLADLSEFISASKIDEATPLSQLSEAARQKLLYGDDKKFPGILMLLNREQATSTKKPRLEQLELFRGSVQCKACQGSRLRPEAMHVLLGGKAIHHITALPVIESRKFFSELTVEEEHQPIAEPLVNEMLKRLKFLQQVGVGYLTLDRSADTLSGGELQRVRLATSIGSGLVGVCYVLDEPSIGLHPRDNQRLIDALRDLQQQGNSVIVVEHDDAIMRQADRLIDMGPGAGIHGGQIVAQGTPAEVIASTDSITGNYLSGRTSIPIPPRRKTAKTRSISIEGVTTNNLKNVEVRVPLGALVCITGVSGSGKSSLINETLIPALLRRLGIVAPKPGPHTSLRGASLINKVVPIDQSPIGRTPRSNPATYTGIFDEIRKVFAGTRDAKQRGYTASRFSFNVEGGRCEACQGQGMQKIEMNFLPDLYVPCPTCEGARFNAQTLLVKYKGKSIADILRMPVEEALGYFENFAAIHRVLESLRDVGLGYVRLGQASTTLSGGEAQRIKLATELARVDTGDTLYLLDEPTTGLHFDDIRRLLEMLGKLVDRGNTVVVIEHNLDVIKCADWLIDLGPEGGSAGGYVLAAGTPEEIAALEGNSTGKFLREVLERKNDAGELTADGRG